MAHLYEKTQGNNVCDGLSNIMAVMHFDLFSSAAHASHLYFKCTHTGPTNIHTEVMWSSLKLIIIL